MFYYKQSQKSSVDNNKNHLSIGRMDTNTIYIVYTRVLVSCTNYSLYYDISGIFTFCTCKKIMQMRFPSSSHQNEYEVRKREMHLIYTVDLPSTV